MAKIDDVSWSSGYDIAVAHLSRAVLTSRLVAPLRTVSLVGCKQWKPKVFHIYSAKVFWSKPQRGGGSRVICRQAWWHGDMVRSVAQRQKTLLLLYQPCLSRVVGMSAHRWLDASVSGSKSNKNSRIDSPLFFWLFHFQTWGAARAGCR